MFDLNIIWKFYKQLHINIIYKIIIIQMQLLHHFIPRVQGAQQAQKILFAVAEPQTNHKFD